VHVHVHMHALGCVCVLVCAAVRRRYAAVGSQSQGVLLACRRRGLPASLSLPPHPPHHCRHNILEYLQVIWHVLKVGPLLAAAARGGAADGPTAQ
jgi:hypothetical protein